MDKTKKIFAIILTFIIVLTFAIGCKKTDASESESNAGESESQPTSEPSSDTDYPYAQRTQGIDFSSPLGLARDYAVVISQSATATEKYAAEQLTKYVYKVTGKALSYETDGSYTGGKVISIGRTASLESSGLKADETTLKTDGFIVKNKGNSLYICGGGDRGTLYGVYDFLEYFLGVKFLTAEATYVPEKPNASVYKSNRTEVPAFDYRVYLDPSSFFNDSTELTTARRFTSEYLKISDGAGGDGYEVRGENKIVYGEDYTFEVIKAEGYDKSELTVKVNGNAVEKGENGKYIVKAVKENLVITVEGAKKNTYTVTLPTSVAFTATGKNTVEYGEDYTFVLKISDRYDKTNLSVKVNGAAVNAEADGETYVVKAVKTDLTVTVEGLDIRTYDVTLTSGTGYELRGEDKAEHGGDYTFELVLSEGYTDSVPVVKVNGEAVEAGEDGKYTVGNVSGEIVITVENVKINVYTVSVKEGEGYTVDGEISKEVNYGESVSFAVAETNAEDIIKVFNGEEEIVLVDGVYTLENVKANAELTVRVYDLASQMFTAINLPKTEYDGYVSVGCRVMSIDSAWVEKVIKAGYTHLKFDTKLTGGVSISLTHGVTWNKYWKSLDATDTVRIDLAEFKDENAYYGWSMEVRDSAGNQTDGVVELYNPTLIRSEETAKWTKSNSSIYCAEEDGYIVLDTRCSGNDAHVLSSEAFCAKYFNNTKAKDAASQYTVIFKGRYLYAGSNTRGMVWGDTSSAVSSVGGSANTDFVIEHANNRNDYAAGNKFYMGLDKEGVYQFAMSKFISSRNSWGGFSCTDFDTNTYKGNMVAEQTLVYAEKIEDLIAAGYTKVVITAEYMGGQLWTGSGYGTKWYYGLNNGETKEWDLSSFDTAACPYLIFYCSSAVSDATVTVRFF